jgi:hypothetical protein
MRSRRAALALGLLVLGRVASAAASVRPAEALAQAFPGAEAITPTDVPLTEALTKRIAAAARIQPKDRLVTFYTARKGGQVIGHAVIHSHVVRTKRETFLLAFDATATITRLRIIAFFEPEEYMPPERWLDRFVGRSASGRLQVGDDVDAITGATLSARGITEEIRWLLAAFRLTLGAAAEAKR